MINRVKAARRYETEVLAFTLESWFSFFERKRLDLNAEYQREYVWGEVQQQELLRSIMMGLPLSAVSVVKEDDVFVYEVVDGKQRLTTLDLFFNDQIGVEIDGEMVLFSELNQAEQSAFLNTSLPMIRLKKASKIERIRYFMNINFAGVPQSEEHHNKVIELLAKEIVNKQMSNI